MKAFLLSAGTGTRLRPLTDQIPKCLVPIDDEPLLAHWLRHIRSHGVDSVIVNAHHLADQVFEFVNSYKVDGLEVEVFHEETLLGTAGTVYANRSFVEKEDAFFVLYADNLTDIDLASLYKFHKAKSSPFTVGLFETPEPEECGIATLDGEGVVTEFEEKPENPKTNLANSGMYIASPSLFDLMPAKEYIDFGYDILPQLVGQMYGWEINCFFCDLGTPERLERGRRDWRERECL